MIALLLFIHVVFSVGAKISVDPATHGFIDEFHRARIFHGMNAVYKIAPWHPITSGFDTTSTLSDVDAKNLKSWGFNIVRLGVMWPGVEPTRNNYNASYLDEIATIVDHLRAEDIYVVLDFHQDLLHRKWCGEGVPDYVYDICHTSQPKDTPEFPLPSVNTTYPIDGNGDPTLDACLSHMFATYYMSAEVCAAFECFYTNNDIWTSFANYWKQIVSRFKDTPNVLGYELINEPWMGDIYHNHADIIPKYTEQKYLQPLYAYLHTAIRELDNEKMIFYEGLTIDYWENGFTETPGGAEYDDRQVLAYHIYCPIQVHVIIIIDTVLLLLYVYCCFYVYNVYLAQDPSVPMEVACNLINNEFFSRRMHDIERLGGGMMMTEFGAAEDIKGDMYALEQTCEMADKHAQSWIYWQFKYYEDITTCTPSGESLYTNEGDVCMDKLRILSRTYPMAVAGAIGSYDFHLRNAEFNLIYHTAADDDETARTTVIYYNRDVHYPYGVKIETSSAATITCDGMYANIVHEKGQAIDMTVLMKPCHVAEQCAC